MHKNERKIELSDFFDEDFYVEQIIGEIPPNLLDHYLTIGWKNHLDPSPNFSTEFYLSRHGDVRENGINPFEHFIFYGRGENRETSPSKRGDRLVSLLIKESDIKASAARLILRAFQPSFSSPTGITGTLADYLESGWRNRMSFQGTALGEQHSSAREINPCFKPNEIDTILAACGAHFQNKKLFAILSELTDQAWYKKRCELLEIVCPETVGMDAATHYLAIGRHFRLSVTPLFDVAFYTDRTRGIDGFKITPPNALIHYLTEGEVDGERPCPLFNPAYYSNLYNVADGESLLHFVKEGAKLDHQPSAAFWCSWYRKTYGVTADNLLLHFYTAGIHEGFLPNPLIDTEWYRQNNSLVSQEDALRHYVSTGFIADLPPHVLIDPDYIRKQDGFGGERIKTSETIVEFYMRNARDVAPHPLFNTRYYLNNINHPENVNQPLAHYIDPKTSESKCPNPYFFDKYYNDYRLDVKNVGIPPLVHYINVGHREQIKLHPLVHHHVLPVVAGSATPLEALLTDNASEKVLVRSLESHPDTTNSSKWLPVAFDVDKASRALADVSIDNLNVGILAHVFYVDLLPEVVAFAENVPQPSVLLISTDSPSKQQTIVAALEASGIQNWEVRVFENRGRDIAPSFLGFLDRVQTLEYAVHIHTKQSRHYGQSFDKWRKYLFAENGGSRARVEAILKTFEANPLLGALAPVDFGPLRRLISWGHNKSMAEALLQLAGHNISLANISLEFPSGSMFWFRVKALRGLFEAGLRRHHFDPEAGQVDGTLAHAIERVFFMLAETEGYDWARFCSGDKLGGYQVTDNILFARSRVLPSLKAKDPVAEKLPETAPFFCRAVENSRARLNLLIPTADQQMGYAGVSEAIRQFRAIGEKLGDEVDLRIISTDVQFDNMTIPPNGFTVSESLIDDRNMLVVPGFLRATEPVGLREKDIFVASAWWTAKQAYELMDEQERLFGDEQRRRMIYLIQDFEPGFYPWSTRWALAENTYRHADRTIAIFNTPLLAEFMTERYAFSATQTFKPMINEDLMIPVKDQLPAGEREKIMLLYARPHAERNCLEMIEAIVFHCVQDEPEFWSDWRFLAIGETFKPEMLKCDRIEVLGRLILEEYKAYLAKSKLGVSIMVSPHPSYPPLEMAANGVRVLANTYDGKDLSKLHENIESFTLFEPEALARQLKKMTERSTVPGKPLVDWFFDGGNNLDNVSTMAAREIFKQISLVRSEEIVL